MYFASHEENATTFCSAHQAFSKEEDRATGALPIINV
jgi:hypothetical protein